MMKNVYKEEKKNEIFELIMILKFEYLFDKISFKKFEYYKFLLRKSF